MYALVIVCVVVFTSCFSSPENTAQNITDSIPAIATPELLAQLGIIEAKENFDLVIGNESNPLDTMVLSFLNFACDCPDWNDTMHPYRYEESMTAADTNCYYIEPAANELELPWRICVAGTKIKFIGRVYTDLGYPANAKFIDPNPPKGRVFRYYSYEVVKPYTIWGSSTFLEISEESGDSMFYSPT
jgi:hypothetical protein